MSGQLTFDETMSGFDSPASTEPIRGYRLGRQQGLAIRGDFRISVEDMDRFIDSPEHEADLFGAFTAPGLGEDLEVVGGRFKLFRQDEGGVREMIYQFGFEAEGGRFLLAGRKEIVDDPMALDAIEDMTTLFVRIYRGDTESPSSVAGAGILRFHLHNLPGLLGSIRTPQDKDLDRLKVIHRFFGFVYGELAQTYLFALK